MLHVSAALGVKLFPDSEYEFLPVRSDLIVIQTVIMAPIMALSKYGYSIDPFQPVAELLTQVFIKMGRQVDQPKATEESKKKR